MGKYTTPSSVQASVIVPSNPFPWFFPWPLVTCIGQYSVEFSKGWTLCISPEFSLCTSPEFSLFAALIYLVLCPENSSHTSLPDSKLCLLSTQGNHQSLPGYPFLHHSQETLFVSWGSHQAYIFCFSSVRDHCPLLSDIWCLENCCVIHFVWFLVVSSVWTIFIHNTSDIKCMGFFCLFFCFCFFHTNSHFSNSEHQLGVLQFNIDATCLELVSDSTGLRAQSHRTVLTPDASLKY